MAPGDLIRSICTQNLGVYRASPDRLREDVGQEAEIAHDYRGRLVYELIQNADDAMRDAPTPDDFLYLKLTDSDLWVGNSGRPLDEADVRGLCGIGASSKGRVTERKRASIGHKGMGFKSVLEITDAPEVFSEDYSFALGRGVASTMVSELMLELGEPPPERVPAMRFPSAVNGEPAEWIQARERGIRTLFRFPLRAEVQGARRRQLAERLLALPATTVLFLKHLERISVEVDAAGLAKQKSWEVGRAQHSDNETWRPAPGLTSTGLYRVSVSSPESETRDFVVAHSDELEIGSHRGGLDDYAWSGIEVSEVSVAVEVEANRPSPIDDQSQVLHVFLPTGERCPFPFVVNGAFSADLSRQEVRVRNDPDDYNGWLLDQAATVFAKEMIPALTRVGCSEAEILRLLDRGSSEPLEPAGTATAERLTGAMRDALAVAPVASDPAGEQIAVRDLAVPPLCDDEDAGSLFRSLLPDDAAVDQRRLPAPELCAGRPAFVLADLGAHVITPGEAPAFLASHDLTSIELDLDESELFWVDPVLHALERMWSGLSGEDRVEFESATQQAALFPTEGERPGTLERVAVADRACFYPPRALKGSVPLLDICFLAADVCWGDLTPPQRQEYLERQLATWQSLFGVREFKFPDVMRSSVLPALTLPDDGGRSPEWLALQKPETLAAVCQLSGRTPNPGAPLPDERLGTNRALFNLARFPVPCRPVGEGPLRWEPAYRVYFGSDWVGDASIEPVLEAIDSAGGTAPDIPFLISPDELVPLLDRYRHLRDAEADASGDEADDEVDLDEDEEEAFDADNRDRWLSFLTWLGVNTSLRPVHFSDVEDRLSGWLGTKNLDRPSGWAFQGLDDAVWEQFVAEVRATPALQTAPNDVRPYFYEAHDLEYLTELLARMAEDEDAAARVAFVEHLAANWSRLSRVANVVLALVPASKSPGQRSKPPRALAEELRRGGDNLWLHRLKRRDFLPTTRGPKRPNQTWIQSREIDRRFASRRGRVDAGQLLPILAVKEDVVSQARPMLAALGVPDEISIATFDPESARGILDRLERIYGGPDSQAPIDRSSLRDVIRPAYRNLVELLPGAEGDPRFPPSVFADAPLLEESGGGEYRFSPAASVMWAEATGTRERLGNPTDLWTFVLDTSPGSRNALTKLFGVRILEEQLNWEPVPGERALSDEELAQFRNGVSELAPFALARLSADRATDRQQTQDATRLYELMAALEPVRELEIGCRLGDEPLSTMSQRPAFVDMNLDPPQAFVAWGETGWPPSPDEAEALATALGETLGSTNFEAFLALIQAPNDAAKKRLLALAGAPTDIEAFASPDTDDLPQPGEVVSIPPEPGEDEKEEAAKQPDPSTAPPAVRTTPLYDPTELAIDGVPVKVLGEPHKAREGRGSSPSGGGSGNGSNGGYGGRTDLSQLDRLGMYLATIFEVDRLRREGVQHAAAFDLEDPSQQPTACIFDISTSGPISAASERSELFAQALTEMSESGINPQAPGCDLLTLRPGTDPVIDRLIELKSSGQNARTQAMTWNEWKTAQNSRLRSRFFLYLAGNLRSDIPGAVPFVRAVQDPYGSIRAQETVDQSTVRKVTLNVAEFDRATQLNFGVAPPTPNPPEDA